MVLTFIETTKFSSYYALAFDYEGILRLMIIFLQCLLNTIWLLDTSDKSVFDD